MISSLRLTNFKNFANESLRVGPFTVIVGTNASGKSNLRDAFRFLHGISRQYTLAEIIGGKMGVGGQWEWEPIRGGTNELIRFGSKSFQLCVSVQLDRGIYTYEIEVGRDSEKADRLKVNRERLYRDGLLYRLNPAIYNSHPHDDPIQDQDEDTQLFIRLSKTGSQRKYGSKIAVSRDKPAITQIIESRKRSVTKAHRLDISSVLDSLRQIRFLEPSPEQMRRPTLPGMTNLGERGENLPTVLMDLCSKKEIQSSLAEWLRELTPMDVKDFQFLKDPSGLIHLMIRDGDRASVSAYSASDGTLRFLSMLAILFDDSVNSTYVFEEVDNGIHPSRMQLLLSLIESQTKNRKIQVVTTTHSSDFLSMINDDTFENASIVARINERSDAIIRPLSELHRLPELRTSQGLGRLLNSGWMEDALTFTQDADGEEDLYEYIDHS